MQQKTLNQNLAGDAADKDSTVESQARNRTEMVAGNSSTEKPLADGIASQSNPRFSVEFISHKGKITAFVGAVIVVNFEMRVCVKIDEHNSFWKHKWDGEVFQEKLNLSEIFFKDIGSHEFFKPWTSERLNNFISDSPAAEIETKQQESNNEEKTMAKKATTKKTKKAATESNGKPSKIAFVDEQLQSGKFTKAEVAEKLIVEFEVPEKTAKNTVSWAASTMKKRTGKVSKHLPKVKADDTTEKPVTTKTEKVKKPAKKKVVKVEPMTEAAAA